LISTHTINIFYGILGSIVATALTGAIYSIVDANSDSNTENSTTTIITFTDNVIENTIMPKGIFFQLNNEMFAISI